MHSTEIGAWFTVRVTAHTGARRKRRRFTVGRVLVLNDPPAMSDSRHSFPISGIAERMDDM